MDDNGKQTAPIEKIMHSDRRKLIIASLLPVQCY